jgi:hypothetical protein
VYMREMRDSASWPQTYKNTPLMSEASLLKTWQPLLPTRENHRRFHATERFGSGAV